MHWDPEVESPATIAILGAGATGIEAALYARFLGYQVVLFEASKIAARYREIASLPMRESFDAAVSPLGIRALEAQSGIRPRIESRCVLHGEFAQQYLVPLARTDLVRDCIQIHSEVIDISRVRVAVTEAGELDWQARGNDEFRILVRSRARGVWSTRADVVLDCSGLVPAFPRCAPCHGLTHVDDQGSELRISSFEQWKGLADSRKDRTSVLWGGGEVARFAVEEWLASSSDPRNGKLIWLLPIWSHEMEHAPELKILEERLLQAEGLGYPLRVLGIDSLQLSKSNRSLGEANVLLPDESYLRIAFDSFLDLDRVLKRFEFATELLFGPRFQTRSKTPTATEHTSDAPEASFSDFAGWRLATAEPGYYLLGSKLRGHYGVMYRERHEEVRDLFALLGGRANLDLYGHGFS